VDLVLDIDLGRACTATMHRVSDTCRVKLDDQCACFTHERRGTQHSPGKAAFRESNSKRFFTYLFLVLLQLMEFSLDISIRDDGHNMVSHRGGSTYGNDLHTRRLLHLRTPPFLDLDALQKDLVLGIKQPFLSRPRRRAHNPC
jgi:hypothetical protein